MDVYRLSNSDAEVGPGNNIHSISRLSLISGLLQLS